MATLTPSRMAAITEDAPDRASILTALGPWRRRLTMQQLVRWTVRSIVGGLVLAYVLLLISRLVPWANAQYWAIGFGIACIVLAFAAALWYRPSISNTARHVDTRLSLHDRMSTAWELRDDTSVLATLQRRDALKQLKKYTPAKTLSLRPHRSMLFLFAAVAIILALLVVLPNPMNDVLRQQAAFQAKIAKQIAAIDKTRQDLAHQVNPSTAQQKQIDQILRELETKLRQAKNNTEAQQAIAEAQAKLDQLSTPQAANKAQGHAAASAALQGSNNPNLSAIGQALSNNNSKQLATALKNLSSQISKLSPQQRSQLAQQIEQAANQASKNPALSSALHQLAKTAANGTPGEVSDAANAVESAAAQDAADQGQNAAVSQASQSLQQAADSIAAATDGTNNQGQSQGQNQNQGQGQGQNQGQGQGKGQGQGQGQGRGQGGQGGQGSGGSGGGNGAGNNHGKNEQVYVPGQIGSGTSSQNKDPGNNGVVQGGDSVPYSQVIEEYNQAAHDAIDNSNVSPDMKDLVHGYFDTLEGQH